MDLFTGAGVALVTLLDDAGGVDAESTGALAADLVGRGMQAVLACGTTGEPGTLTDAERLEVIRAVRDAVPPGVPVLAGTGATSRARAAELTAAAAAAGADAILAWPPPGCDDLVGYYAELGRVADGLPVLAYLAHYPGCTYTGSSALLALAGPIGGAGAILAAANAEPELCCAAFSGDAAAQRRLTDVHLALREGGVPALKQILAERRGTIPLSRPVASG